MDFGLGLVLTFTDKASAGISGVAGALVNLEGAATQSQSVFGRLGNAMSSLSSLGAGLTAAVTAPISGFMGKIVNYGIQRASFVEDTKLAFTTLMGSAQEASDYMNDLMTFAKTTPFTYESLTSAAQNLIASGVDSMQILGDKMDGFKGGILQALGDVAGATGVGATGFAEYADIIGKIAAEGKVTSQRLQQLAIRGMDLTSIFGKSQEELKGMASDKFMDELVANVNDKYYGMMASLKNTWTGAKDTFVSSLKTAGLELMGAYKDAEGVTKFSFLDKMTESLNKVSVAVKNSSIILQPYMDIFSMLMTKGASALETFTGKLSFLDENGVRHVTDFGQGVSKVISVLTLAGPVLTATGKLGGVFFRSLDSGIRTIGTLVSRFGLLGSAIGLFAIMYQNNFGGIQDYTNDLIDHFKANWDNIKTNFFAFKDGFIEGFNTFKEQFLGIVENLANAAQGTVFEGLFNKLHDFIDFIGSADTEKWKEFGHSFGEFAPKVALFVGAFMGLRGVLGIITGLRNFSLANIFGMGRGTGAGSGRSGGLLGNPLASPKATAKTMASVAIIVGSIAGVITALGALYSIPHFSDFASTGATIIADIFSHLLPVLLGVAGVALVIKGMDFLNLDVKTVALGVANIAIIVGGISALVGVLGAVTQWQPDLFTKGAETMSVVTGVMESFFNARLIAVIGLISAFGFVPVKNVTLGLANLSILIGGMGLLTGILGALTELEPVANALTQGVSTMGLIMSVMESMFNMNFIGTVALMSVLGFLPVQTALTGLANIAIFLGGIGAIVSAFGALALIPGLDDFLSRGGDTIANLLGQVGKIAGTVKAEFEAAQSESLPTVGDNMAKFGQNVAPFFEATKSADVESVGQFTDAISRFILSVTASDFASLFTGDLDLGNIGTQLSDFGNNIQPFFDVIKEVPQQALDNTKKVFEALGDIGNYNFRSGGVAQFFTGEVNIGDIGEQLATFADNGDTFFNAVANYSDAGLEKAPKVFEALAGIGDYDFKTGGVAQFFTGETNIKVIAEQLAEASTNFGTFFNAAANYNNDGLVKTPKVFEAISGIGNYDFKTGGVAQFFTGNTSLKVIGEQLAEFAKNGAVFFAVAATYSDEGIRKAPLIFQAIAGMGNYDFKTGGVAQFFTGGTDLGEMGKQLVEFGENVKPFFDTVSGISEDSVRKSETILTSFGNLANFKTGGVFSWFTGDVNMTDVAKQLTDFAIQMTWFYKYMNNSFVTDENIAKGKKMFQSLSEMGSLIEASNISTGSLKQLGEDLVSFGESYVKFMQTLAGQGDAKKINIGELVDVSNLGNIISAFDTLVSSINNFKDNTSTAISSTKEDWQGLVSSINTYKTQIINHVKTTVNSVQSTFDSADLSSSGANMMKGLISGMESMRSEVMSVARSIAEEAASTINNALKVQSPSKVMMQTGRYIDQGLALGMVNETSSVESAAQKAVSPILDMGEAVMNAPVDFEPVVPQTTQAQQTMTPLVRESVNNVQNTSNGGSTSNNSSVTFSEGAIAISIAQATEEEAKKLAQQIMTYIDRQKDLNKLMNYQNIGLPTPELAAL